MSLIENPASQMWKDTIVKEQAAYAFKELNKRRALSLSSLSHAGGSLTVEKPQKPLRFSDKPPSHDPGALSVEQQQKPLKFFHWRSSVTAGPRPSDLLSASPP
eukprot:CAMPEP_0115113930 /NCGR_PEP_ID=MMETSP0227-20121206/41719_1 /TAXON_ID=89957 /ORGANISM="Polarella glacialis, Strain CCMP 1383" /LENGTH=102 /DNA_ID=CAMNT_0002514163 /DNA_START=70 /DNA_END=374 /DNA_ORIENTATION=-